jgi:3-oxosteroid 1-dehydrogenase
LSWDREVDFVVVGSGAAGMAAAVRAASLGGSALVLEKTDRCGGSTAMSGGVCWVPNNPDMQRRGLADDREAAIGYLTRITEGTTSRENIVTYVDQSLRVMQWLEANSHVRYTALERYSDYYPDVPGGRPGGRSMDAVPFDGTALGDAFRTVRPPHPQAMVLGRLCITPREAHTILLGGARGKALLTWRMLMWTLRFFARRRFGRDPRMTAGNALIGRLLRSLQDRGVPVALETSVRELVTERGRVVGVIAERAGVTERIGARRGVLLAAGGFSRNAELRRQHQPVGDAWHAGNLADTGDAVSLGRSVGAAFAHMERAWWTPVTRVPGDPLAWVLVVEKSLPGSIIVDRSGRRFVNEAAPYLDVAERMLTHDAAGGGSVPSFLVFDATFRHKYPCGPVAPGYAAPDARISRRLRDGFLTRAASLAELAAKIEVDADGLARTVARFNTMAAAGVDEDFHRGENASDLYYTDASVRPNPSLAPLATAPFYAIPVFPGDLGTKGGIVTDVGARAMTADGAVIPGLFAAGNSAASVMGSTYPGAGGTIGPALTFGVIAAESAFEKAS